MTKSTKSMDSTARRLILPRGYISWSAYSTFLRSKEQYIRHYFYGESGFQSQYLDFGKVFDEYLANRRKKSSDPVMEMAVASIKPMPKRKYKLEAMLQSEWGPIKLLGEIDQYTPTTHDFDEFKSGKRKWTQNMANSHGQLKFYQLMLWLNHRVTDNKKQLIWAETKDGEDGVELTGRIQRFPVDISLVDIFNFGNEVIKVAKEISDLYRDEINKSV